jgi:hypothetical protein
MRILRNSWVLIVFIGLWQVALAQNTPPRFTKIVRDGVVLENIHDLDTIHIKEGETPVIEIYAEDPDEDIAYITATGCQSWMYFFSVPGSDYAKLLLLPEDNAEGDYTLIFETFDNATEVGQAETLTVPIHVIDRNQLSDDDKDIVIFNYPNPVKSTTTLEFVIPIAGKGSLKIYSLSGREMMTVFDSQIVPGRYFRKIDISGFPTGTYIYRLTLEGKGSTSGRMIKL